MLELAWAARSHTGNRRSRNEDSVLARPGLFAVADGMGGHAAGDLASQWTVEALNIAASTSPITRLSVLEAVRGADARLRHFAHRERQGIGTTVCALAVTDASGARERLGLLNVGDSRAYRLRDGHLDQLTRDHSVVQELIDAGTITGPEARRHPERHVVTRSLGGEDHLEIDWWALDPVAHDRYLLATDGLTKEVNDTAIRDIVAGEPDPHRAADALIEAALAGGGRDNVSVIVIDVVLVDHRVAPIDVPDPLDGDTTPRSRRSPHSSLDADTEPSGRYR
jgi:protein phosphatase